jgi:adenine-specific DNA-methyltransferase
MASRISYMGTKHELAAAVSQVIESCQPGRLMDAFSGMGAVAEAHAGTRQVWTNDVQHFAHLASTCRFTDQGGPMSASALGMIARPLYSQNLKRLRDQNEAAFKFSRQAVKATEYLLFERNFSRAKSYPIVSEEAYGCFIQRYSHSYFSVIQCAEIDSIRFALETLRGRGSMSASQFDWAILALGRASLRLANTTGHFAQFLSPSRANFRRVCKQFSRSIWTDWLSSISRLPPVGQANWRSENLATRSDSTSLLRDPSRSEQARVVYCDPPYTDDQYSRYYHVWETLVLYDYPETTGKGLYRPGRFTTSFSLSSKVVGAFQQLISDIAAADADLVLSYPSNGLLHKVGACPLELIREVYPSGRVAMELDHSHSTLGASKGAAKASVTERIYVALAA